MHLHVVEYKMIDRSGGYGRYKSIDVFVYGQKRDSNEDMKMHLDLAKVLLYVEHGKEHKNDTDNNAKLFLSLIKRVCDKNNKKVKTAAKESQ